jgi:hypothetical protein
MSPIASLHVEAGEMPLKLQQEKLALQYVPKLESNPSNPTYDCIFKPTLKSNFYDKPSLIPPLTYRLQTQLKNTEISLNTIAIFTFPDDSLWQLQTADFLYVLKDLGKKERNPTRSLS